MMLKRMQTMMAVGVVGAMVTAGAALAGPSQIKFTNVYTWGQTNGGGPFEVQPIGFDQGIEGIGKNGAGAGRFFTFCVERNEHIGGGRTYDAVVNTVADNGGISGGHPDPLDSRTAFLYTAFTKGTIADKLADSGLGSTFAYGTGASGEAIQNAIWFIEGELTNVSGAAKDLVTLADNAVQQGGEWFGKGIGNVRILNLTVPGTGGAAQDQLVMIPLPIPAVMGLVGLLGVGGMVLKRRRLSAEVIS